MAWSRTNGLADGFATSAAMMLSLALALVAIAATTASVTQLKSARADFDRTSAQNLLAGAQQNAALTVANGGSDARLRWSFQLQNNAVKALAEPEGAKASVTNVVAMDDSAFATLGVTDPKALRTKLSTMSTTQILGPDLAAADESAIWKACARSLISPFGQNNQLQLMGAQDASLESTTRRTGEIWRVRVADGAGWADDRIVRFTGDLLHPAAVVERRFFKLDREGDQCDSLLKSRS